MQNLLIATLLLFSVSAFAGKSDKQEAEGGNSIPAMENKTIRIDINHKGEIFMDGESRTLSGLKEFFEERGSEPEDKILVIADEETLQDDVIAVMDICSTYKYRKIKLFYKPSWIHKG